MINKILRYYANCDGCGKAFLGKRSIESKKTLEILLAEKGWNVIDGQIAVCPSCQKKLQKKIS